MKSIGTRIQDAVLAAIENLVIPGVELAVKSANAGSERSFDGNVLEPDQKDFLGDIEGLPTTVSGRINSHMDLKRIDDTHGSITVEEGNLLANEKNLGRQAHGSSHYHKK